MMPAPNPHRWTITTKRDTQRPTAVAQHPRIGTCACIKICRQPDRAQRDLARGDGNCGRHLRVCASRRVMLRPKVGWLRLHKEDEGVADPQPLLAAADSNTPLGAHQRPMHEFPAKSCRALLQQSCNAVSVCRLTCIRRKQVPVRLEVRRGRATAAAAAPARAPLPPVDRGRR